MDILLHCCFLGALFVTVPKSVHFIAPVTSDMSEHLWKMGYFSIALPFYLQTAMGSSTKDVSPSTTERAQKTKIPNFLSDSFSPLFWGVFKPRNSSTKRWELEQELQ